MAARAAGVTWPQTEEALPPMHPLHHPGASAPRGSNGAADRASDAVAAATDRAAVRPAA